MTSIAASPEDIATVIATENEASSSAATAEALVSAANKHYTFNAEELAEFRKKSPWRNDPKWFKDVTVSPTAIVKMVRIRFFLEITLT